MKKLNIDQLLDIVASTPETSETRKSTKVYKVLSDVEKFIKAFNIKDGKYRVYVKSIYKSYHDWSMHPIDFKEFNKEFSLFFESTSEIKSHFLISVPAKRMLFKAAEFRSLYVQE